MAFSLGNFASDMVWMDELRSGAVLHCALEGDRVTEWSSHRVRTGRDYRTSADRGELPRFSGDGLPAPQYAAGVAATLRKQRLAAYRHALLNAWRFPPAVLAELVGRTLANKLRAVVGRYASDLWPCSISARFSSSRSSVGLSRLWPSR